MYVNNNNFFIIMNDYYIYLYNSECIYHLEIINNNLYIFIKNKNKENNIQIKIIYKDLYYANFYNIHNNIINIGDITKIIFNNIIENNIIFNNIIENRKIDNIDIQYYIENNKLLKDSNIINLNDIKFINYHWHYCGKYNGNIYFKYLLKKYEDDIYKIKYEPIHYSKDKKNTLLFIDDRYDSSFIYLLILFIYSIDNTWNITIFTSIDNIKYYENDLKKLNSEAKIILLEKEINNIIDYSNLLKDVNFWNKINEDNCLLFQYDSFAMGKFDNIFFNYPYIGAKWEHRPSLFKKINIGNGGTSFRKTRIMEYLCYKYKDKSIKNNYPEDIFFCELLYEEKMHHCTEEIADKFSFENIYCNNSIYAHQIYKSIVHDKLDAFVYNSIQKMI